MLLQDLAPGDGVVMAFDNVLQKLLEEYGSDDTRNVKETTEYLKTSWINLKQRYCWGLGRCMYVYCQVENLIALTFSWEHVEDVPTRCIFYYFFLKNIMLCWVHIITLHIECDTLANWIFCYGVFLWVSLNLDSGHFMSSDFLMPLSIA